MATLAVIDAQVSRTETTAFGSWVASVEVYDLRPPAETGASERWRAPGRPGAKELRVIRGLLHPDEAVNVLRTARKVAFEPEAQGSTNPVQTPVATLMAQGRWIGGHVESLQSAIKAAIEERIVPFMREAYGDPSLVAAEVLIRRYVPSKKREHALHFDHHAAATCIVDLTPQQGSGLFVQPGPGADSRLFVPLHNPGDAAVHGWDVFHGVALQSGHERVSVIVWAKPLADAWSGRVSWYNDLGKAGDIDAAYRLGMEAEGRSDTGEAIHWYDQAATSGHWMAMFRLGRLLAANEAANGFAWIQRSASYGWAEAQIDVGDAHQRNGDHAAAVAAYRAAAAQRHPGGLHRFGLAHLRGLGVAPDEAVARRSLEASAQLGWADAQFLVAQSFASDEAERAMWLTAAMVQGHPGATNSLAIAAAKDGRHAEARELLLIASQRGHHKAMANLAIYLHQGLGGPADPVAAEHWMACAQRAGTA